MMKVLHFHNKHKILFRSFNEIIKRLDTEEDIVFDSFLDSISYIDCLYGAFFDSKSDDTNKAYDINKVFLSILDRIKEPSLCLEFLCRWSKETITIHETTFWQEFKYLHETTFWQEFKYFCNNLIGFLLKTIYKNYLEKDIIEYLVCRTDEIKSEIKRKISENLVEIKQYNDLVEIKQYDDKKKNRMQKYMDVCIKNTVNIKNTVKNSASGLDLDLDNTIDFSFFVNETNQTEQNNGNLSIQTQKKEVNKEVNKEVDKEVEREKKRISDCLQSKYTEQYKKILDKMCKDEWITRLSKTEHLYRWNKPICHLIYFAVWLSENNFYNSDYEDKMPWAPLSNDFKAKNKNIEAKYLNSLYNKGGYIGKKPKSEMEKYLSELIKKLLSK